MKDNTDMHSSKRVKFADQSTICDSKNFTGADVMPHYTINGKHNILINNSYRM